MFFLTLAPKWHWAFIGGAFLSFGAYSYPPIRLSALMLLVFLPLFYFTFRKHLELNGQKIFTLGFSAFVGCLMTSIPLLISLSDSKMLSRSKFLSIANKFEGNYFSWESIKSIAEQFTFNMFSHFSADYLFISGDKNLRHSAQIVGQLSWLDAAILVIFFCYFLFSITIKQQRLWLLNKKAELVAAGFVLSIIFITTTPAALTWEGLPHSLRSCAAISFWSILLCILARILFYRFSKKVQTMCILGTIALAGCYSLYFLNSYFTSYKELSAAAFDAPIKNIYETDYKRLKKKHKLWFRDPADPNNPYPEKALVYFQMHYFNQSCADAKKRVLKNG